MRTPSDLQGRHNFRSFSGIRVRRVRAPSQSHVVEQLRKRNLQSSCNLLDIDERHIPLAAFNSADVYVRCEAEGPSDRATWHLITKDRNAHAAVRNQR